MAYRNLITNEYRSKATYPSDALVLKLGLSDEEATLAVEVPVSLVREDILSQHRQEVEALRREVAELRQELKAARRGQSLFLRNYP